MLERITCSLLLALLDAGSAAPPPSAALPPPEAVDAFMQTYYQHPRAELVPKLIAALNASASLQDAANASPALLGFFTELFLDKRRLHEWHALVEKQGDTLRATLRQAETLSGTPGGVLSGTTRSSAQQNDVYWGAFFASGKPVYLNKLIGELRHFDERQDLNVFMAGMSAKWSLCSNARRHPIVRASLEDASRKGDARTRALIAEVLTRTEAELKEEAIGIVRAQKEAGLWK